MVLRALSSLPAGGNTLLTTDRRWREDGGQEQPLRLQFSDPFQDALGSVTSKLHGGFLLSDKWSGAFMENDFSSR